MLWTDVIDPADQTGFARQTAEDYEAAQGTLARWLPNRTVDDFDVAFTVGDTGLTEVAEYRSYDAETPIGDTPGGQHRGRYSGCDRTVRCDQTRHARTFCTVA